MLVEVWRHHIRHKASHGTKHKEKTITSEALSINLKLWWLQTTAEVLCVIWTASIEAQLAHMLACSWHLLVDNKEKNVLLTIPEPSCAGEAVLRPTITAFFTSAPLSSPQGVPLINFISIPANSLLTMTKSWNWMAPQLTHSAPFSQFQVVRE